jgi:hypothetical protein
MVWLIVELVGGLELSPDRRATTLQELVDRILENEKVKKNVVKEEENLEKEEENVDKEEENVEKESEENVENESK